jgi:hypothetical protein
MTEQNRDATDYMDAAHRALDRRLEKLDDAYFRGVHTEAEYESLCAAIIAEHEKTWK